jgi:hypothetical protein
MWSGVEVAMIHQGTEDFIDVDALALERERAFDGLPFDVSFECNRSAYRSIVDHAEVHDDYLSRAKDLLFGIANALHEAGYQKEIFELFATVANSMDIEFNFNSDGLTRNKDMSVFSAKDEGLLNQLIQSAHILSSALPIYLRPNKAAPVMKRGFHDQPAWAEGLAIAASGQFTCPEYGADRYEQAMRAFVDVMQVEGWPNREILLRLQRVIRDIGAQ